MLARLSCALRRLACCWAGRVALRENRARQHRRAGARGSEAARPKINLFTSPESPLGRFPAAAAVGRCAPPTTIEQAPAAWYPADPGSLPPPALCPTLTAAATALSPTVAAPLSCSPPVLTAAPRR